MTVQIARLIVEGDALKLWSLPDEVWADALAEGCSPAIVQGVRAAREAFLAVVPEAEMQVMFDKVRRDIEEGLSRLESKGD